MSKGDWHGLKFSFWKSAKKSCKWNQIGLKSKKIEALSSWLVTNPKNFQDSATKNFKVCHQCNQKIYFFQKEKQKTFKMHHQQQIKTPSQSAFLHFCVLFTFLSSLQLTFGLQHEFLRSFILRPWMLSNATVPEPNLQTGPVTLSLYVDNWWE